MNEQCLYCQHFRTDTPGEEIGECRRYPPVPLEDEGGPYGAFPFVAGDGACGEFKRKVM